MSLLKRWIIPGVVAVGAVASISLWSETSKIEADLTNRSNALLAEKGMEWAKVSYSGRDGTLTGRAPTEAASKSAVDLLLAEWGVRVVDDATELLAEQKPFTWGLEMDGSKPSMFGFLTYDLSKTAPAKIASILGADTVAASVEAARGGPAKLEDAVILSANVIKQLPKGKAMLIDNKLTISGALEDGNKEHVALYGQLKDQIAKAELGDIAVEFEVAEPKMPEAPKPVVEPVVQAGQMVDGFSIRRTEKGVDLNGVVPSQKIKDNVLRLAQRKFGFAGVNDNLSVQKAETIAGLTTKSYTKITQAILQAVSRLGDGQASLTAEGLRLSGGAYYQGALKQVEDFLNGTLPADLAFQSDLKVAEPGAAVAAEECQTLLRGALETNSILFQSGKATISADSFGLLDGLIYTARRCTESRIQIEGHTDSDGDAGTNQALSEKRAASVVTYLTGAGVEQDRLDAMGFGETKPVADNGTPEGKAKNRRIEFVILAQ